VKNAILFHYDPAKNDKQIDEFKRSAEKCAKETGYQGNVITSYEGLELKL